MHDDDPVATYGAFAKKLNDIDIAFIEVVEDSFQGNAVNGRPEAVIQAIRENFKGAYIANGNYSAEEAYQRIDAMTPTLRPASFRNKRSTRKF